MTPTNGRKLTASAQEALRIRVVRAIDDGGMSKAEAARTFGVGYSSIHGWMIKFRDGGYEALKAQKRGPKSSSTLAGWQAAGIVRTITDRCPDQLKLPFALWTREAVGQLIFDRFGIEVSVWTVGRYLKRWGFTPQKPLRRAYERDPQAVETWLKEEYPEIRKRAKADEALIYWGDEMGLRSDHQSGTSYAPKGKTPVVKGTGRRFGCNMISALTNRGQLNFMIFKERFTTPVMLTFLKRLVRQSQQKVYLILDSHPVHRSMAVKRWVATHAEQIELFFLPGYSPELNPDEYLNNDVKDNAVGRRRPNTQSEMMDSVRSYLRSTQKQPHIVRRFFHHKDVRYAAG